MNNKVNYNKTNCNIIIALAIIILVISAIMLYIFMGDSHVNYDIKCNMFKFNNASAPKAKEVEYTQNINGNILVDNYHWLRSKEWPGKMDDELDANKEIISYLKAENKYTYNILENIDELKEKVYQELKGKIKLTNQSLEYQKGDYFYYSRTEEQLDYPVYCRKYKSMEADEEIILDVNDLARGSEYIKIGGFSVNPDHKLLAYSIDYEGSEKYHIHVLNLENGKYLHDKIPNTIGAIVWHEQISGFFYTPVDDSWRHRKLFFHQMGTEFTDDKLIYEEKDELYNVSVSKTSSKNFIKLNVSSHDNNEIYLIDMHDLLYKTNLIQKRQESVLYDVDHGGGYFYMMHNKDADNFKIDRSEKNPDHFKLITFNEYIKEDKNRYLNGFDITKDYLLLDYTKKGVPNLFVRHIATDKQNQILLEDESSSASIYSTNYLLNDIRISYSSLKNPNTTYGYDFLNDKLKILKEREIPSGFNRDDYEVKRLFVNSTSEHDEAPVKVPMTVIYKKSLFKKDGSNPAYIYGYGSYGHAISPSFIDSFISMADRGFVCVLAHIRGGDDLGFNWYKDAKFLTKKRTFTDFIDISKYLVKNKYTSRGNIAIKGGSAGGMLIGNVINQEPDLYKFAILHVPFVDVLNTMLDDSLPLTVGEFKEWGNPRSSAEYFDYIKSYSPYDNIKKQNYPHIFVTAGLSDPRVGYFEPAKYVAKLRAYKSDNNLLILKTNMDFGHSGASSRFEAIKESALDLALTFAIFNCKK